MTIEPRLMSGTAAAAYLGITLATFSRWVTDGRAPKPLPGTRRWDRKALDLALDKLSGIKAPSTVPDESPFEIWKRDYDARNAARLLDPEYIRKQAEEKARLAKRRGRIPPRD
jgi:hypothetical protein